MAKEKMTAVETVRKGLEPEGDFLRDVVRWTVQELMDAEVSAQIGAERYERTRRADDPAQRLPARASGTRASARSTWPSPSCGRAATSRAGWSRAGAPSRR